VACGTSRALACSVITVSAQSFLFKTAQEIWPGTGTVKKTPLDCPRIRFTKFVRSSCTGTRFYQLCLDQSEIAIEAGRTQES